MKPIISIEHYKAIETKKYKKQEIDFMHKHKTIRLFGIPIKEEYMIDYDFQEKKNNKIGY